MNTLFPLNKHSWLGMILGLLTLLGGSQIPTAVAAQVGDTLPDLKELGLEGDLPDLKGKIILLDFFASWCEPCKKSFPVMQSLHQDYASKGLVILAVSVDEKLSAIGLALSN
jgi:thiol-disulfide isomerase/thioredoxin